MVIITKVSEFIALPLSNSKAYLLGLIVPLLKEIPDKGMKSYVVGQVSHNPNKIDDAQLLSHFKSIVEMCNNDQVEFLIKDNTFKIGSSSISSKVGFSVILENDVKKVDKQLTDLLVDSINWDLEHIKMLIRGFFDGRSSVDTTYGYLSLDVDRNYEKQDEIKNIINTLGIEVNINKRTKDHSKKDQIRIARKDKDNYITLVGFFSVVRLQNYKMIG